VKLKKLELSDAEGILECFNIKDKKNEIFGLPYVKDLESSKKLINDEIKKTEEHKFVILLDDKIAGMIELVNPSRNKKIYEIGYALGKNYWNKGIATRAVKELVKYAFDKLKLKRIWAGVDSDNPASGKVLEKAGFKLEGVRKGHINYGKGNHYSDEILWGLLK
jgi:[ribosomal protein S5]-alanine N-acetyltransferase